MKSSWLLFKRSLRLFVDHFSYLFRLWAVVTGIYLGAGLLGIIISIPMLILGLVSLGSYLPSSPWFVVVAICLFISFLIIKFWLDASVQLQLFEVSRGSPRQPVKHFLKEGWQLVWKYLAGSLLSGVIAFVTGLLVSSLFIVPAVLLRPSAVLSGLLYIVGFVVFIVLTFLISVRLVLVTQIIVAEKIGALAALTRSNQLVHKQFGRTLLYILFIILLASVYGFILTTILKPFNFPSQPGWLVTNILFAPFYTVSGLYYFLLYRHYRPDKED
jgi:hypothetical protein